MTEREGVISKHFTSKLLKWNVKQGEKVRRGTVLATYEYCDKNDGADSFITSRRFKSKYNGKVVRLLATQGDEVRPGEPVIIIEEDQQCEHTTVMKDMCCDCGMDLRKEPGIPGDLNEPVAASLPVVHNIPELRVSVQEAETIARRDEKQLLKSRKLALVVDLDQTLIHTTHESVPGIDAKDVMHFHLPGHHFQYHTKLRPGAIQFLEAASKFYELHIFTMGSRMYAHKIARILDPDGKLFAHRIRSRDECLDMFTKSQELRSLFPCGDHMVCIIDDREDVWRFAPNLVTVKPYRFFLGVGDINNPFETQKVGESNEEISTTKKEDGIDKTEEPEKLRTTKNDGNGKDSNSNTTEATHISENVNGKNVTVVEEKKDCISGTNDNNENKPAIIDSSKVEDMEIEEGEKTSEGRNDENSRQNEESLGQGESQTEEHTDLDDYLYYLEEILERIHMTFYSTLDEIKSKGGLALNDTSLTRFCTQNTLNPDVRVIVPELQSQTLKGVHIVFTGVIPTNVPSEKSTAWRTAVSLGAKVSKDIVIQNRGNKREATTHVVAARLGTQKAHKASKIRDVKLVSPDWLWCCAQRWELVDERLFPVPERDKSDEEITPEPSRRGTPFENLSKNNNGSNGMLKISPLAEPDKPKTPTPEELLSVINPLAFSRAELSEMDKEVEELMQEDNDCDYDANFLGSISESDSSRNSSGRSSNNDSKNSLDSSNALYNKRKPDSDLDLDDFDSRQVKRLKKDNCSASFEESLASSESSESDSEGETSESEEDIGALLERRISESS